MIKNPVLRGFNPDPCMICDNGTFYIANSTFEYYPGVKISKSKDLANWETVGYPLLNKKHINLQGSTRSCGIWAPNLIFHNGIYYLTYTDVKTWSPLPFKDTPNYITCSKSIDGEWSDPYYINSSGFDPSLFFDDDGKMYFVNMEWDYRKQGDKTFNGILLTELDPKTMKPISEPLNIFKGTERGLTEGPHIYKRNNYYYLVCAEGGTTYEHAVTVARSRNIEGPYEFHPNKHLATTWNDMKSPLQKVGHGSICEGPDGRWWLAFLCSRPLNQHMMCPLGRETGISEIIWKEDWPYLKNGSMLTTSLITTPAEEFEGYGEKKEEKPISYKFDSEEFKKDFQSLRIPCKYDILKDNILRIYGKESLYSTNNQSMLVRRQTEFSFVAETLLRYNPTSFHQMAGLIYRYSEENQFYFKVSYEKSTDKRTLNVLKFNKFNFTMGEEVEIPKDGDIYLKLEIENGYGYFYYSFDKKEYFKFPTLIESEIVSDDNEMALGFTGAFVGMACQDMQYENTYADFLSFEYKNI